MLFDEEAPSGKAIDSKEYSVIPGDNVVSHAAISSSGGGNVGSDVFPARKEKPKADPSGGDSPRLPGMLQSDSRSSSGNTSRVTAGAAHSGGGNSGNIVCVSRGTSETSLLNASDAADGADRELIERRIVDRQSSAPVSATAAAQRRAELLKQRSAGGGNSSRRRSGSSNRSDASSRTGSSVHTAQSINYKGVNIFQAAAQGSLPLCVLLWGMASPKRVNLMTPDHAGNTPLHYAALADTADVIGFLLQQSRGYISENMRLVDVKNQDGETPLLRAMSTGVPVVIKALAEDAASDLLVTDNMGGTVFSSLAKGGHLWSLNYMYHVICTKHGVNVAQELLHSLDVEGHSALDWAADAGDVNVMEFFIRKGVSPLRADPCNRTALFWAVKAGHVAAARYLVLCGCDPLLQDSSEQSALSVANSCNNYELTAALTAAAAAVAAAAVAGGGGGNSSSQRCCCSTRTAGEDASHVEHFASTTATPSSSVPSSGSMMSRPDLRSNNNSSGGAPVLYSVVTTGGGRKVSHAIFNQCRSRVWVALLYGLGVFFIWALTVLVPSYAWILALIIFVVLFRRYEKRAQDAKRSNGDNSSLRPLTSVQKLLLSHEKGLGVWLGSAMTLALFLLCSYFVGSEDEEHSIDGYHSEHEGHRETDRFNPTNISGLSAAAADPVLFWATAGLLVAGAGLWCKLVWIDRDPGIIDTRDNDFEEVMAQSLVTSGPPPSHLYCRTTLVKKPIRSKYCARTGCVVARMDHYCIWLNVTVGHGNHRSFLLFLLCHLLLAAATLLLLVRALHREIEQGAGTCGVLDSLLGIEFFFPVIFSLFLLLMFLGLAALSTEQLRNMARNMTTNERINMQRYSWMVDQDGRPRNKFDRGVFCNVLEFCRVPGYAVDYTKLFLEPDEPVRRDQHRGDVGQQSLLCRLCCCCCYTCRGCCCCCSTGISSNGGDGSGGSNSSSSGFGLSMISLAVAAGYRRSSSADADENRSSLTQENIMRLSLQSSGKSESINSIPALAFATANAAAADDLRSAAGGGVRRDNGQLMKASAHDLENQSIAESVEAASATAAGESSLMLQQAAAPHWQQMNGVSDFSHRTTSPAVPSVQRYQLQHQQQQLYQQQQLQHKQYQQQQYLLQQQQVNIHNSNQYHHQQQQQQQTMNQQQAMLQQQQQHVADEHSFPSGTSSFL